MPITFDGPARVIKPPGPDPPAEAAPRPQRAGWAGHTARWPGTSVTGRTLTSGAFVSGCANAAARSPASRSTRGVRSSTSQPAGASRSAGVTGAARLSHASRIDGVRGAIPVKTPSTRYASSPPAVAAARRSTPGLSQDCSQSGRAHCPRPHKADAIAEFARTVACC
jgi:hypothetical protein